jgi:hypothetical protein
MREGFIGTALIAGRKGAGFVVLRTQTGGTDRGDDSQELLERHMQIEEATLTEDPPVIIEDFIRNHERETRERGDRRKSSRLVDSRRLDQERIIDQFFASAIDAFVVIAERHHVISGASRHE